MALSLVQLISNRIQDLGITRGELARRMGYANIATGYPSRVESGLCPRQTGTSRDLFRSSGVEVVSRGL